MPGHFNIILIKSHCYDYKYYVVLSVIRIEHPEISRLLCSSFDIWPSGFVSKTYEMCFFIISYHIIMDTCFNLITYFNHKRFRTLLEYIMFTSDYKLSKAVLMICYTHNIYWQIQSHVFFPDEIDQNMHTSWPSSNLLFETNDLRPKKHLDVRKSNILSLTWNSYMKRSHVCRTFHPRINPLLKTVVNSAFIGQSNAFVIFHHELFHLLNVVKSTRLHYLLHQRAKQSKK